MLGIFANSFRTATRTEERRAPKPKTSWLEEDLPFRRFAGQRSGRDD